MKGDWEPFCVYCECYLAAGTYEYREPSPGVEPEPVCLECLADREPEPVEFGAGLREYWAEQKL